MYTCIYIYIYTHTISIIIIIIINIIIIIIIMHLYMYYYGLLYGRFTSWPTGLTLAPPGALPGARSGLLVFLPGLVSGWFLTCLGLACQCTFASWYCNQSPAPIIDTVECMSGALNE